MLINTDSEFGKRVARRLQDEIVIWLSTISQKGSPQTRPVWFYWDGDSFLIFSRPHTAKLSHISHKPSVSLNFDGDGSGGNIIVFNGQAQIMEHEPPANEHQEYSVKYASGFQRIGMTPRQFAETYSIAIRIWPESLRGH